MNLRPRGDFEQVDSGFDPGPILKLIVRAWPVYILMFFIGLFFAHYLVKNAQPKYQIDASLKVNRSFEIPTYGNEENITGLRIFSKICNIYNYIGRINTRDVLGKAYCSSNLEVQLLKKNKRIIENRPFIVHHAKGGTVPINATFKVRSIDENRYRLTFKEGTYQRYNYSNSTGSSSEKYHAIDSVLNFKDTFHLPGTYICLEPTEHFDSDSLEFAFEDLSATLDDYQQRLRIKTLNKGSSAITISITTDQPEKDKKFIASIMNTFSAKDLRIKKALSSSTLSFLNKEQNLVEDSLLRHRQALSVFKNENRFMNMDRHSVSVLNKLERIDTELSELETKERYYSFLLAGILDQVAIDTLLAPVLHTEQDAFLVELISQYRTAELDLEEINYYAGPKNPGLLKKKAEIEWLQTSIAEGLSNLIAKIGIEREQLNHRASKEQFALQKLPSQERKNIHLERLLSRDKAQLKYLQKKSAGAGLAYHTLLPDTEVLQKPLIKGNKSVTPLNAVAYAFVILIALCIPFLFQQISTSAKGTIMGIDDIEKRSEFPLSAVLPEFNKVNFLQRKLGLKTDRTDYKEALLEFLNTRENKANPPFRVMVSGSRTKVGTSTFLEEFKLLRSSDRGLLFISFIPTNETVYLGSDFLQKEHIPEPSPFTPIVNINMSDLLEKELLETDECRDLLQKLSGGNWDLIVETPDLNCPVNCIEALSNFVKEHWIIVKDMHSTLNDLNSTQLQNKLATSIIYNQLVSIVPWYLKPKKTRLRRLGIFRILKRNSFIRTKPKYRTERL